MPHLTYAKPQPVSLKRSPEFTERWVQQRIAEDPAILGLGDLILKDSERLQPSAGRLDLLLQDPEVNLRYEVELQLGATDESHIIRTIEYWDVERKRYPQYDHVAVIVAEDVTSRFLNVIGLLNGVIPLVAIQLNAVQIGDVIALVFTKVLDQRLLGALDEDEEKDVTDRAYWEKRGTPATVKMADQVLKIINEAFDDTYELKYNKFYIGLATEGEPRNFVIFRAQKQGLRVELRLDRADDIETRLAEAGIDVMDYSARNRRYRLRLSRGDVETHAALLSELLHQAHDTFSGQ